MKIFIVTPYFAPAWSYGGPPRVLFTLAKELVKIGHRVTVITTDSIGKKRSEILKEHINNITVHRYKTISNILSYRYKIFFVRNLLHKTEKMLENADCVLFSDVRSLLNWQLFLCVLEKRIPYGVFAFGQIPRDTGLKAVIKKIFDFIWVKSFIQHATWRFAQTEHEQKMYNKYFGIPLNGSIQLPLPVEIYKNQKESSRFKENMGWKNSDKLILSVGRYHYLKGMDLLLTSLIPLVRQKKNVNLVFIGRDDGYESTLRSLVPSDLVSKIKILGPLYDHNLDEAYQSADCFVLTPRYYEETSTASLEALQHGVPIIVSKEAEVPFLNTYGAGYCISRNANDLRDKIKQILFNKNRIYFRKNAIRLIHDVFDVRHVVRTLEQYLMV